MNEIFIRIFGQGSVLETEEMAARAAVMFFIALVLMRIADRRSLGLGTPFDIIISLLLGSTLARGIIGGVSFGGACAAGFVLAAAHRLLAMAAVRYEWVGQIVNGKPILLFRNGQVLRQSLLRGLISEKELLKRLELHAEGGDLSLIETAWLETNGEIGVVLKKGADKTGSA